MERDNLEASAFPPAAPINARPDWQPEAGLPAMQAHVLDRLRPRAAICNVIHGAQMMMSEDLSAALCRAINDWLAAEWLDRDPRLRASIVVPVHSPELAAEEIERRAADPRFVQVLLLAMTEMPLGRRMILADLQRGGAARPAHRHPCRLQLPPSAERGRLGVLLPRGLCRLAQGFQPRAARCSRKASSRNSRACGWC